MNRNTMDYKEFIIESLFVNIIAFLNYRNLVFMTIRQLTIKESNILLLAIVIASFLVNFIISGKWCRNWKAVIVTCLLPFGVYTSLAYFRYYSRVCLITWIMAVVVVIIYLLLVYKKKLSNKTNLRKAVRRRRRRAYVGVRNIVATASGLLIGFAIIQTVICGGMTSKQVKGTAVYGDEYALAENIDMFLLLQPEEWEKLGDDLETKLSVLQTVVNCEGRYMGFNKKITVYTANLNLGTLGYYNARNNAIYIDTDHIIEDSSKEVLETVLHEGFHVSQHQIVEIYNGLSASDQNSYFMKDARELAIEFADYTDGEDDFYCYYSQKCESTARGYGKANAQVIFDRIDEYLKQVNNSVELASVSKE